MNKQLLKTTLIVLLAFLFSECNSNADEDKAAKQDEPDVPESEGSSVPGINLPDGFKIEIFAEVDNARSMAISPAGVIYVGNRTGDNRNILALSNNFNANILSLFSL